MRWELSDEQTMVAEAVGGWVDHVATSGAVRDWIASGDPTTFEQSLAGEGWLGVGTPEDVGGQGGGLVELALVAEAVGRATAPAAAWLTTVLAVPALAGAPDLVTDVLDKGGFAALAVRADTPADTGGGDVEVDGDRLAGRVPHVLGADRVRHLVVPVRTDGHLRWWAVATDAAGIEVVPHQLLDGTRSVADVHLDGAVGTPLTADPVVGLRDAALRGAVLVAADSLGAMVRMLDMTVEYTAQRQQFGSPIGAFQAVQHAAAQMLVDIEAARSIVYLAAEAVDSGHPEAVLYAAAAKAQVTAAGARCADSALTVHGAIGYTWEYDLQLPYKRAWLDRELAGSPTVWNERLASALPLVTPA